MSNEICYLGHSWERKPKNFVLNFKYSWQAVWFEGSNLTLEEILKLTYWWCRDVQQETMRWMLAEIRWLIGIVFVGRYVGLITPPAVGEAEF